MDKRAQVTIILVVLAIFIVAGYRYKGYVLDGNYTVLANTVCDASEGHCFVSDCSPGESENCDQTPYKKVTIERKYAPECILNHTCESFYCGDIPTCSITYCSDETLDEGEICNDAKAPDATGVQ
ncbi:MAG TPA: hypothetical protein VG982_02405 [Candidatus Paceibacterota bacterium]|nr:hypothetical protein [Candidatus Paceibacterota bacterium]